MPFNHTELELRLSTCSEKLLALFDGHENDQKLKQKIEAVKAYYTLSYRKAKTSSEKTIEAIAASYELFIDQLSKVKTGILNPKEALENIESTIESRKINVLFHDVAKTCEFLFWTATTVSLYVGIFAIALPVLIAQPILGVALGITFIGAMLAAASKAISCLTEFKSLCRHDTEYTHEVDLVSFFKLAPQKQERGSPIKNLESGQNHMQKDACGFV